MAFSPRGCAPHFHGRIPTAAKPICHYGMPSVMVRPSPNPTLLAGMRPRQRIRNGTAGRASAVSCLHASFLVPWLVVVLGRPTRACTKRAVRLDGLLHFQ